MSFRNHYITFSNGNKMPLVGLGTWLSDNETEAEEAVDLALQAGYRHIDTAFIYRNEEAIGKTLKKWFDSGKLKREDIFITTKLPMNGIRDDLVEHFLRLSLHNLQLDYVDLYLIHAPFAFKYVSDLEFSPRDAQGEVMLDMDTNLEAVWKAMEAQVDAGLAKSIGVSNFNAHQVERIVKVARIPPANNQVEIHVYFQQKELRNACSKYNVTMCAYAPLGSTGRAVRFQGSLIHRLMDDPVVQKVAEKHKKNPSQVLLRFLVQNDIVVIPKSSNPDRIKQNIDLFDFKLDDEDMEQLTDLDKGKDGRSFSMNFIKGLEKHPEYYT